TSPHDGGRCRPDTPAGRLIRPPRSADMTDGVALHADRAGNTETLKRAPAALIVFTGAVCLGALLLVAAHTVLSPANSLQWSSWAYSEWLISYEAGFVRRGLAGTLIKYTAGGRDLLPVVN